MCACLTLGKVLLMIAVLNPAEFTSRRQWYSIVGVADWSKLVRFPVFSGKIAVQIPLVILGLSKDPETLSLIGLDAKVVAAYPLSFPPVRFDALWPHRMYNLMALFVEDELKGNPGPATARIDVSTVFAALLQVKPFGPLLSQRFGNREQPCGTFEAPRLVLTQRFVGFRQR